jgi:hypothetical protein
VDGRTPKPVDQLTPRDLETFPVWEYDLATEGAPGRDETWVRPVEHYPVASLSNRVIGGMVTLRNGTRVAACLSNVDLHSEESTREFLLLGLWHQGEWLHLARYFDADYAQNGPLGLSRCLGLPVDDIFPIQYDISLNAVGPQSITHGFIEAEPTKRRSDEERMTLIFKTLR